VKIKTDNRWRELLHWHDLTESEQVELKDNYDNIEESSFFRYKSHVYDLNDFMRINGNNDDEFSKWHGHVGDSYFSGVLIKLSECGETVMAATYYS